MDLEKRISKLEARVDRLEKENKQLKELKEQNEDLMERYDDLMEVYDSVKYDNVEKFKEISTEIEGKLAEVELVKTQDPKDEEFIPPIMEFDKTIDYSKLSLPVAILGSKDNFKLPAYVACEPHSTRIMVLDTGNSKLSRWDFESQKIIQQYDQFEKCTGLAMLHRAQNEFGPDFVVHKGGYIQVRGFEKSFHEGAALKVKLEFYVNKSPHPTGRYLDVAVTKDNHVIAADTTNHSVKMYDVEEQKCIKKMGAHGMMPGTFMYPKGLCMLNDVDQYVVADSLNNRLQVFSLDGKFVKVIGRPGIGQGEFQSPCGVCVTPDNHIIVTDQMNHRIQVFTSEGAFVHMFGHIGSGSKGEFNNPTGICCAPNGRIIIVDQSNHRIQIY